MAVRCLVVEDEFFTRDVLSLTLRRANIDVDVVESGAAALEYLQTNQPDVALIDLHMPNIDGYDVINAIRADKRLQNLIIIIITANPSAINTPEAQAADAFLSKPLDIQRVVEVIRQKIQVRQS